MRNKIYNTESIFNIYEIESDTYKIKFNLYLFNKSEIRFNIRKVKFDN